MAVADRSYSFRGAHDLGERMDHVREVLARLQSPDDRADIDAWVLREYEVALARRLRSVASVESQSAFMRVVMEAFVGASEKVEREIARFDDYSAFAAQDHEGDAMREALLRQAAESWE